MSYCRAILVNWLTGLSTQLSLAQVLAFLELPCHHWYCASSCALLGLLLWVLQSNSVILSQWKSCLSFWTHRGIVGKCWRTISKWIMYLLQSRYILCSTVQYKWHLAWSTRMLELVWLWSITAWEGSACGQERWERQALSKRLRLLCCEDEHYLCYLGGKTF